jgi:D-xylose transport system ATP-binding protein
MARLELRAITKEFPGVRALDGVSFALEAGQVHALCGENGAGKSTLIKVLSGYHPAGTYGGEILLDGQLVQFRNIREAEHHGIALIAQELALVPELSVAENVMLGREPSRHGLIDWPKLRASAQNALERVGLAVDLDRPVRELGVGQQQMVEIAKALAKDASILVLDEPTAALTEADADRLLELLRQLRGRGLSAIYISHRLEEVFRIADRVTVLRDGRSVGSRPAGEITQAETIALMVGREVTQMYPRPPRRDGKPALAVEGWSVADPLNPGRRVVEDVSLTVHEGEVLGVAGLMGAGRTALVSSLFGAALSGAQGRLSLAGGPWRAPFRSPSEAIAAGVALVSEDRKRFGLVPDGSVGDNLTLVTLRRFVRRLLIDHTARERDASAQAQALRIRTASLATAVRLLSGGNQQKVVLGKWLMAAPRVLLLDEPTRGIDVGAKAEVYQLVAELAGRGLGVVLVSSELPEVLGMSHRVLVLSQGRATALLDAAEATPERVMEAATRKVDAPTLAVAG